MDDKNPDLQQGLDYWKNTPASIDGVLGGFGNGTLPRTDAISSRQFILSLLPELCTVPSALRRLDADETPQRKGARALDVGAGIGRVTSSVLLHLIPSVVILEPVEKFVEKAIKLAPTWKGIASKQKSVTFLQGPLQFYDPSLPLSSQSPEIHLAGREGAPLSATPAEEEEGFDIIWCQWCLGHLSDHDLVSFFRKSRNALRKGGFIVVKENLCDDCEDGGPGVVYDEEDSSLTRYVCSDLDARRAWLKVSLFCLRSNSAWHGLFKAADLTLVREEVQRGFPVGLFEVKMYALQ
ncbi:hypothetical protein BOTBODRAFT_541663 [Botryobasidium botryosum FD-172 SS1]|uniref:Alpha N-terminal protein methyltransferase 1 n=1 Tax=Botryobasidium botryosum (strain FD-172 SS1) TaxID=930990 RepID=A0A067N154_BOTB1|nr:hypothetical protein BOTBODRAFT_541663 [Botryobasidium botryosum FD-172 SS1]